MNLTLMNVNGAGAVCGSPARACDTDVSFKLNGLDPNATGGGHDTWTTLGWEITSQVASLGQPPPPTPVCFQISVANPLFQGNDCIVHLDHNGSPTTPVTLTVYSGGALRYTAVLNA
jgi:hypothetical protein